MDDKAGISDAKSRSSAIIVVGFDINQRFIVLIPIPVAKAAIHSPTLCLLWSLH
jgi:hypothetical protein